MKRGYLPAALALLVAALAGGLLLPAGLRDRRPDLVLVVWDTCRADRWASYGWGRPTTPNVDAFAKGAARFEHCYATSPWTAPSHGSMFTGLLPGRHGLDERPGARVRADLPLLAETLRSEGYETVGFTANAYISPLTGLSRGFDSLDPAHARGGEYKTADGGVVLAAVERWLGERRAAAGPRKPLFLFVNLMETHLPFHPSEKAMAAVRDPAVSDAAREAAWDLGGPDAMLHNLGLRPIGNSMLAGLRNLYEGAVREADAVTGELFRRLREEGILEDAVVVVTADHGEHLGEGGRLDHRMTLHDAVIRVPLVVRWPGRFDDGRTVATQVSLADLHPTLLEAAGAAVPAGTSLDAESLTAATGPGRPVFTGLGVSSGHIAELRDSMGKEVDDGVFDPLRVSYEGVHLVTGEGRRWKFVRSVTHAVDGTAAPPSLLLRDLAADPAEEADGSAGDPGVDLEALLDGAAAGPTVPRRP